MLCGPVGCQGVIVQDQCPGCSPSVIDLSEQAHRNVCGVGTCEATAEVIP